MKKKLDFAFMLRGRMSITSGQLDISYKSYNIFSLWNTYDGVVLHRWIYDSRRQCNDELDLCDIGGSFVCIMDEVDLV